MAVENVNWSLVAAVGFGVILVLLTALLGNAAGLQGPAAFAAPLLVGIVVAAGIRLGYG